MPISWYAVSSTYLAFSLALVTYAATGAAPDWQAGHDVPSGWVGVLTGGGMIVGEAAGVHIGRGRIVTAAHALPSYEVGWHVDVYQSQGIGHSVAKQRAVVRSLDTRSDIAHLELVGPTGFSVAQTCEEQPSREARVLFFKTVRDRQTVTGVVSVEATYAGLRKVPEYADGPAKGLAGAERYAFVGAAEPGMSGGGAYSVDHGCFFGIASMVDVISAGPGGESGTPDSDPVTFVIPAHLLAP